MDWALSKNQARKIIPPVWMSNVRMAFYIYGALYMYLAGLGLCMCRTSRYASPEWRLASRSANRCERKCRTGTIELPPQIGMPLWLRPIRVGEGSQYSRTQSTSQDAVKKWSIISSSSELSKMFLNLNLPCFCSDFARNEFYSVQCLVIGWYYRHPFTPSLDYSHSAALIKSPHLFSQTHHATLEWL